jgi:hypothetical protein
MALVEDYNVVEALTANRIESCRKEADTATNISIEVMPAP